MIENRISIVTTHNTYEMSSTNNTTNNNMNVNMNTKLINSNSEISNDNIVRESNQTTKSSLTSTNTNANATTTTTARNTRIRDRSEIRSQSYHAESTRELSIIARHQERLKQGDRDAYSKWTINDQLRLVALDALHAKEKEYHNLIPSSDALDVIDIQKSQVSLEDLAAKIVFCSSDSMQHNQFYEKMMQYNNDTTNKATPIILPHRNIKSVLSTLISPNQGNFNIHHFYH